MAHSGLDGRQKTVRTHGKEKEKNKFSNVTFSGLLGSEDGQVHRVARPGNSVTKFLLLIRLPLLVQRLLDHGRLYQAE